MSALTMRPCGPEPPLARSNRARRGAPCAAPTGWQKSACPPSRRRHCRGRFTARFAGSGPARVRALGVTGGSGFAGRRWRRGWRTEKSIEGGFVLALLQQQCDRLVDLDALRAFRNDDLSSRPSSPPRIPSSPCRSRSRRSRRPNELVPLLLEPTARLPSVIVGDSAGMRISMGISHITPIGSSLRRAERRRSNLDQPSEPDRDCFASLAMTRAWRRVSGTRPRGRRRRCLRPAAPPAVRDSRHTAAAHPCR